MNTVVISMGSNINPTSHIHQAKQFIATNHQLLRESKVIVTKPIGSINQANYLNGAILIRTKSDQESLQSFLKTIEHQLGRVQYKDKFAPRTIDLDIVVWNNKIIHQDAFERDFVKNSIREVLPNIKIK